MAHIVELDGVRPSIGEDVYLAPTAVLIGDVQVGDRSSVWFGAVLRGDLSRIQIGERCSIQDTAVIHCAIDLPTIVGDGGVVAERMEVAPETLAAGVPVKEKKRLSGSSARWSDMAVEDYQELRRRYLNGSSLSDGSTPVVPR
jgi:carbonic anhydrase/acetyltransferase-like protein (isoleucine patch superfamily)